MKTVPCISTEIFNLFIKNTKIIDDNLLKLNDVQIKFTSAISSKRKTNMPHLNPETGLIRY
jgi:hypothetical protein